MNSTTPKKDIIPSSGNVFLDLGFDEAEAESLARRADEMASLRNTDAKSGDTRTTKE